MFWSCFVFLSWGLWGFFVLEGGAFSFGPSEGPSVLPRTCPREGKSKRPALGFSRKINAAAFVKRKRVLL